VELDFWCVTPSLRRLHVNKVTIGRVAKDLGEEEDWLWDIANGIDPEDGLIWVFGVRDNGVMARSPTSASSP
jgi:hypothetical protein